MSRIKEVYSKHFADLGEIGEAVDMLRQVVDQIPDPWTKRMVSCRLDVIERGVVKLATGLCDGGKSLVRDSR